MYKYTYLLTYLLTYYYCHCSTSTTTSTFGFCLTGIFLSIDYSRLGVVPNRSPKEDLLGILAFRCNVSFTGQTNFLTSNQQYYSSERKYEHTLRSQKI